MKGLKEKLKQNGVKNLIEYGYPEVNTDNIMTDIIYSGFFKSMLKDNIGTHPEVDTVIRELLSEIKED